MLKIIVSCNPESETLEKLASPSANSAAPNCHMTLDPRKSQKCDAAVWVLNHFGVVCSFLTGSSRKQETYSFLKGLVGRFGKLSYM